MKPPGSSIRLSIAHVVPVTEAEGPGKRFALWLQGCPLRCPGCCNPEMLPFAGGQDTSVEQLIDQVEAARAKGIEGVTLLGGEPFAQAAEAAALARAVQQRSLTVMVFSGFTLAELRGRADADVEALLGVTDILVDGPYLRERPDTKRRWIGSTNQQVHFLTDRYRADDACWQQRNTLEIRWRNGVLNINGFPAPSAVRFWSRRS